MAPGFSEGLSLNSPQDELAVSLCTFIGGSLILPQDALPLAFPSAELLSSTGPPPQDELPDMLSLNWSETPDWIAVEARQHTSNTICQLGICMMR